MSSSAASTAMQYRFEYDYTDKDARKKSYWTTLSTSPIQALNYYHEWMQRHADTDSSRNVLRPKLEPDQYKLTLFKRDGLHPYDLPIGSNPDLRPKPKVKAEEPAAFGFFPETAGAGRLAT
jgi:hypothetical protein